VTALVGLTQPARNCYSVHPATLISDHRGRNIGRGGLFVAFNRKPRCVWGAAIPRVASGKPQSRAVMDYSEDSSFSDFEASRCLRGMIAFLYTTLED
jgi:hypothetical protein